MRRSGESSVRSRTAARGSFGLVGVPPVHDRESLTWLQFRERFRSHNVPAGVMKTKQKEFLALKQGTMTVTEYRDRFLQLARYAPAEVADDRKKQEHFMEVLRTTSSTRCSTSTSTTSTI